MYPMLPSETQADLSHELFNGKRSHEWPDDPFYQIPLESAALRPDPIWAALWEDLAALGGGIRRGIAWIRRRPGSTTTLAQPTTGCDREGRPYGMS
ncbi:MAG TPA: hypothetical protein VFQ54_06765 [Thermomicrobiales bacterium]|nr:hypothetical protein [Thermomicrobiales bacterium]